MRSHVEENSGAIRVGVYPSSYSQWSSLLLMMTIRTEIRHKHWGCDLQSGDFSIDSVRLTRSAVEFLVSNVVGAVSQYPYGAQKMTHTFHACLGDHFAVGDVLSLVISWDTTVSSTRRIE